MSISDTLAAFVSGKSKPLGPEQWDLREHDAQQAFAAAQKRYGNASFLAANNGDANTKRELEAAREEYEAAKVALEDIRMAREQALAIEQQQRTDAAARELDRRWRQTAKHLEAREKHAKDVVHHLGMAALKFAEFQRSTDDANRTIPKRSDVDGSLTRPADIKAAVQLEANHLKFTPFEARWPFGKLPDPFLKRVQNANAYLLRGWTASHGGTEQ